MSLVDILKSLKLCQSDKVENLSDFSVKTRVFIQNLIYLQIINKK